MRIEISLEYVPSLGLNLNDRNRGTADHNSKRADHGS